MTRLGIIGCGLIGGKRFAAAPPGSVTWVADVVPERAAALAAQDAACRVAKDWPALLQQEDVDAVVVATTHDLLAPIAGEALARGKHVLVEKPGARSAAELAPLLVAAQAARRVVKVGFNHRFHPALARAHAIVREGALGPLMFLRGLYGHGGRVGYEKEWRADAAVSGGGELIDQGMHLVDLARWFLGDLAHHASLLPTSFWKMAVEDNAFLLLQTPQGQVAHLHASWSEWKNMFSFEVYGRDAKLRIDGLGGSYGVEQLTLYTMSPEMGPPTTETWSYPEADASWRAELHYFLDRVEKGGAVEGGLADAHAALVIVGDAYAARTRRRKDG